MQGPLPPPAPPFLAEGAEIYGYVLRRRLGAGGFGEVWLAANSLDGAEVALKFPRLVADLSLDLLRREAGNYRRLVRAMVALPPAERPPIVAVLHDLTRHDPPALVMEYVSGGDLRTWFAARGGRALSFEESLPIVRDILAALVFAHAHNLVHRDLSPDNVLLDPASRRWKVADFGLGARHRAALPGEESDRNADRQLLSIARSGPVSADLSTLAAGKAHYMAPEQELGGRVGPAADIYALGVIWAQLLMGDLSSGLPATWYPRVPEAARPHLLRCLETDPLRRAAAHELVDALRGPAPRTNRPPAHAREARWGDAVSKPPEQPPRRRSAFERVLIVLGVVVLAWITLNFLIGVLMALGSSSSPGQTVSRSSNVSRPTQSASNTGSRAATAPRATPTPRPTEAPRTQATPRQTSTPRPTATPAPGGWGPGRQAGEPAARQGLGEMEGELVPNVLVQSHSVQQSELGRARGARERALTA